MTLCRMRWWPWTRPDKRIVDGRAGKILGLMGFLLDLYTAIALMSVCSIPQVVHIFVAVITLIILLRTNILSDVQTLVDRLPVKLTERKIRILNTK